MFVLYLFVCCRRPVFVRGGGPYPEGEGEAPGPSLIFL